MSPVNFSFFRSIPTKIKLNGPLLKIIDQPDDALENSSNFVTFEVSAVAEYLNSGGNPDGAYLFKWYLDGMEVQDVSQSPGSNASIVNIGGTSKLTLTEIDQSFDGKQVYVEVDYISALKEGTVINSPLRSNTVTVRVTGRLEIVTQPEGYVGGSGLTAPFDIVARTLPDVKPISYRWQMGGEDLVDGLIDTPEEIEKYGIVRNNVNSNGATGTEFTVKSEDGSESFIVDWSQLASFDQFAPGKTYIINTNDDITTKVILQGGGGGQSGYRAVRGSSGGSISANLSLYKDKTYYLQVGSAGEGGVKRYESEVEHVFNSRTDQTISLDESNNITVTVMNPNQNDPTTPSDIRLPCNGDINARYYKIKFNTPFQDTSYQIKIINLSSISAGGGPGLFTIDTIKNKTVDGFDVWFCKTNPNNGRTANSFIRSFTLNVFGMKVGEDENGEGGFPGGGSSVADENKQNKAAGGGGYTALFENSISHESVILIAGGGGGSSSDPGVGGDGGKQLNLIPTRPGANGINGEANDSSSQFGYGGGTSLNLKPDGTVFPGSPSAGGGQGGDGSALKGGDGFNTGAGGGGGYYGGGGGGVKGPGAGGGGSSYANPALTKDMEISVLSSNYGDDGQAIFVPTNFNINNLRDWKPVSSPSAEIVRGTPGTPLMRSVTYGGGKYVISAFDNVLYSTDGINWNVSSPLPQPNTNWVDITYGDGKFVAVADNVDIPNGNVRGGFVMFSTDLISWTVAAKPINITFKFWRSIAYGGGKFVAIATATRNGNDRKIIAYSSDALFWESANAPTAFVFWQSITYGNGKFVAVGSGDSGAINGRPNGNHRVMYSTDGINWTGVPVPLFEWQAITFGGGKFVAVGPDAVMYSTDGINWNLGTPVIQSSPQSGLNGWRSVAYGNDKYVAVAPNNNIRGRGIQVMESYDGVNWSDGGPVEPNEWSSIGFGDRKFVAIAPQNRPGLQGQIMYEGAEDDEEQPLVVNVSGAFTPNLRLYTDTDDIGATVNCNLTAEVSNSPLLSNIVSYQVLSKQPIVSFEAIDTVENWINTRTINFSTTESFTLNSSTFGSQYKVIQFHSKETDFILTMDIKSSAGLSVGGNVGGEGGTSKIKINIKKDFEYTILGVSDNSSIFIYEKSRLIVVVGQGGNAGQSGVGGDGGGANVDGRTGGGINPGVGGERPVSGTLTTNGVYGSVLSGSNITLYSEDSISSVPNPGRTISCSKGLHYINSGFSPCEDIGDTQIQFVDQNGVTYSQSPLLNRGFKAGYTITDTAGRASDTKSGNGGNGATGGQGGVAGAGGGGGSGYVDEEVIVVNTSSGGNSDVISSIVFSID